MNCNFNFPQLNQLIDKVFDSREKYYISELTNIQTQRNEILKNDWCAPFQFLLDGVPNHGRRQVGIYMIYYVLDISSQIYYIGQGNIESRKNRHRLVFKNKGMPIVKMRDGKTTSSSDSVIGRKMYYHDSNPYNWFFSYMICDKTWAKDIERNLVEYYCPPGNDQKMRGVG